MAKTAESKIKLTVDDSDLERKFKAAEKHLDDFEKQVAELGETTEREGKKTSDAMEKAANSTLSFKNVLGALGVGYSISQFKDLAVETVSLGIQFERLGMAADTMGQKVGLSAEEMVSAIQAGSEGSISKIDALSSANQALALNVVKSKEDLETLAEAAYTLGTAMDMGPTEAFNDLVTAMGRGSSKVLDNLGIVLKQEAAYETYAAAIGKSTEALTEQEKAQAFAEAAMIKIRERLDELGPVQQTTALATDQMAAAWDNLKVSLGSGVIVFSGVGTQTGGLAGVLQDVAAAIDAFTEKGRQLTEEQNEIQRELIESSDTVEEYNQTLLEQHPIRLEEFPFTPLAARASLTREEFEKLKSAMDAVDPTISKQVAAWRELEDAVAPETVGQMLPTMQRIADLTTYGIERNRAYVEGVNAMQSAYVTAGDAAEKKFFEKVLKGYAAADQAARQSASAMADFLLGMQDIEIDMAAGGADTSGIAADADEQRIQNKEDLNTRLAELDKERSDKIAWVHTGDWARSAEQNAADLQFWNDHYDKLQSEAILGYMGRNVAIQQKEDEATAAARAAAAERAAVAKEQMDTLKLTAALSVLETQGQLEQFTGGMATSAAEAAKLVQAGLVDLTDPAKASMLVDALGDANAKVGEMAQTQLANEPILDRILSGQVDAIDKVNESAVTATQSLAAMGTAPQTTALAGAGAVPAVTPDMQAAATAAETLGQSVVTSFDAWMAKVPEVVSGTDPIFTLLNTSLPKAYEDNNTKWGKSIDEMKSTVTDAKWEDEVGKPIVEGIAKGITDNKQLTDTAMTGLVNSMIAAAQTAAGVASPSTEGYYIGEQIGIGLAEGIQSGRQIVSSEAKSLLEDVFVIWEYNFRQAEEYGNRTSEDIKERIKTYIEEVSAIPGQTMGEMIEKVWQLLQQRYARADNPMRRTLSRLMVDNRSLIDDLIRQYGQGLAITTEDVLSGMFGVAGLMGSMGQTAIGLQRTQSTARIKALQEQLMLLDDQSTALADQQAILENIEAERERIKALEETSAKLQEQQAQLQFLQQQAQLLDMIRNYNLNPADVLGGLKLGLGADMAAVAEAMTRAMEIILQRANAALGMQHGGAFTVPPGYPRDSFRVGFSSGEHLVVTPRGAAPAIGGINVTFGQVSINNGMDLAIFKALVVQTIRQASRV